jgi:hypothetical protein
MINHSNNNKTNAQVAGGKGPLNCRTCILTLPRAFAPVSDGQLSAAQGSPTSCLNFDFAILNLFEPSAL